MRRKYVYDGIMFDSSIEIVYYIWIRDSGEAIQRSNVAFPFVFNGKTHYYIPDFYLP